MRLSLPAALLLGGAALAACDRQDDAAGGGTSISINSNRSGEAPLASLDGNSGEVAIDVPGFEGKFKLPKLKLDAGDFDLNGVPLYPGSSIRAMNVNPGGGGEGVVSIRFDSPADPARVRAYFQEKLTQKGFTLRAEGGGLTGETEEKRPFRLQLDPQAGGRATGTITVG